MTEFINGWVIKHKVHGYYFIMDTKNVFWSKQPQLEGLFVFNSELAAKRMVAFFCSGKIKSPFSRTDFMVIPYIETGLNLVIRQ